MSHWNGDGQVGQGDQGEEMSEVRRDGEHPEETGGGGVEAFSGESLAAY
jgi:hypothetical protein